VVVCHDARLLRQSYGWRMLKGCRRTGAAARGWGILADLSAEPERKPPYATLKLLHILSIVVWIGGMVFAHFFLRPAVLQLPPPQRLPLMHGVLQRFFSAVLVAIGSCCHGPVDDLVAPPRVGAGRSRSMPLDWTIMATLGIVMMAIFGHIRFALFKRLSKAVVASDWPAGGAALASIRTWVSINLAIGVVIIVITLLMA
jgi:uncharacterized membrane protein